MTISPNDQPDTTPIRESALRRTLYQVRREWRLEWNGILIIARKGYTFDAASIPRLVYSITGFTPDGIHRAASLAHDIACDMRGRLIFGPDIGEEHQFVLLGSLDEAEKNREPNAQLTPAQTHRLWHDLLKATEGSRPIANFIKGWTVRLFGPRWHPTRPPPYS